MEEKTGVTSPQLSLPLWIRRPINRIIVAYPVEIAVPVEAIDHVQIVMPTGEEATARRFYADLLGIPEVEKPTALAREVGAGSNAAR